MNIIFEFSDEDIDKLARKKPLKMTFEMVNRGTTPEEAAHEEVLQAFKKRCREKHKHQPRKRKK